MQPLKGVNVLFASKTAEIFFKINQVLFIYLEPQWPQGLKVNHPQNKAELRIKMAGSLGF